MCIRDSIHPRYCRFYPFACLSYSRMVQGACAFQSCGRQLDLICTALLCAGFCARQSHTLGRFRHWRGCNDWRIFCFCLSLRNRTFHHCGNRRWRVRRKHAEVHHINRISFSACPLRMRTLNASIRSRPSVTSAVYSIAGSSGSKRIRR